VDRLAAAVAERAPSRRPAAAGRRQRPRARGAVLLEVGGVVGAGEAALGEAAAAEAARLAVDGAFIFTRPVYFVSDSP
jgi:hypothetical protein